MLAHSPKDRSRSPHRKNGTNNLGNQVNSSSKHSSNQNDTSLQNDLSNNDIHTTNNNNNNKVKKDNERMKNLKVKPK